MITLQRLARAQKHTPNKQTNNPSALCRADPEVSHLPMPAFKHHGERPVAYEVLPAELELPHGLHLPAPLIRSGRLLFGVVASDPRDSSSSRSRVRVVKAAAMLKPTVVSHVLLLLLPSPTNPPVLCHGSWSNR